MTLPAESAPQANPPAQPLVYEIPEAAEALRVGPGKVYELVRGGAIPALKLGERIVIPRRGLVDWLDAEALRQQAERAGPAEPEPVMTPLARRRANGARSHG